MDNYMDNYTKDDLDEALRSITSMIQTCEKSQEKIRKGTPQHSVLSDRIKALEIAAQTITNLIKRY